MPPISIPEGITACAERFAGREWVLDEVIDWLDDPGTERFLLITGEPGAGKTALVAWLTSAGAMPAAGSSLPLDRVPAHRVWLAPAGRQRT